MRVKNFMTRDERKLCQELFYQTTNTLLVAFGQPLITQEDQGLIHYIILGAKLCT